MRHSTHFGCVLAVFLLLPAEGRIARAAQPDESAVAAARELADTYSNMISLLSERLFVSFLPPQRDAANIAHMMRALVERFREIYIGIAAPIFARRLTIEDMQALTRDFKAPAFQTFTAAVADSTPIMISCMRSDLAALPKPQASPSEDRQRLARQLWVLQQEANPSPPQSGGDAVPPPASKKLQEEFARLEDEWRKRSDCIDDAATVLLATRLTADALKGLIALEQSPLVEKLNVVMEEVKEQFGQTLAEEFQKMFGVR